MSSYPCSLCCFFPLFLPLPLQREIKKFPNKNTAELVARSLAQVAPSLCLTASSEAAAFLLGAISTMPAVRAFSLYAGVAVIFNFLLQVCTDWESSEGCALLTLRSHCKDRTVRNVPVFSPFVFTVSQFNHFVPFSPLYQPLLIPAIFNDAWN